VPNAFNPTEELKARDALGRPPALGGARPAWTSVGRPDGARGDAQRGHDWGGRRGRGGREAAGGQGTVREQVSRKRRMGSEPRWPNSSSSRSSGSNSNSRSLRESLRFENLLGALKSPGR